MGTGLVGTPPAGRKGMTEGEKLLKLIEEMVELKVELHAGLPRGAKTELAELFAKKRFEDQHRLNTVRQQIIQLFNG